MTMTIPTTASPAENALAERFEAYRFNMLPVTRNSVRELETMYDLFRRWSFPGMSDLAKDCWSLLEEARSK